MLIDDDEDMLKMLNHTLQLEGFDTIIVADKGRWIIFERASLKKVNNGSYKRAGEASSTLLCLRSMCYLRRVWWENITGATIPATLKLKESNG